MVSSKSAPTLIIIKSFLFCSMLSALSLTASWDAASTMISVCAAASKPTFSVISGLSFSFVTSNFAASLEKSKT